MLIDESISIENVFLRNIGIPSQFDVKSPIPISQGPLLSAVSCKQFLPSDHQQLTVDNCARSAKARRVAAQTPECPTVASAVVGSALVARDGCSRPDSGYYTAAIAGH